MQIEPHTFGFLVTDIARLFRAEIDRRVADAGIGLTAGEGRALTQAARLGPVRQATLADNLGVEAMTMSTYLDRLEAQGLVERRPDPTDRRAKLVHLTGRAEEVVERVATLAAGLRAELSAHLDPEDWRRTQESLRHVRETLSAMRSAAQRDEGSSA